MEPLNAPCKELQVWLLQQGTVHKGLLFILSWKLFSSALTLKCNELDSDKLSRKIFYLLTVSWKKKEKESNSKHIQTHTHTQNQQNNNETTTKQQQQQQQQKSKQKIHQNHKLRYLKNKLGTLGTLVVG